MQLSTNVKRSLLVLGVLIVLAAGFFIWQLVKSQQNHTAAAPKQKQAVVVSQVCTDDIVKQASPLIASGELSALSGVVGSFEGKANHKGDANCDYIRVAYYTAIGNVETAQNALDDMRFAWEAGSQYSLSFNPPVPPVEDLQRAIDIQKTLKSSESTGDKDDLNRVDKVKP